MVRCKENRLLLPGFEPCNVANTLTILSLSVRHNDTKWRDEISASLHATGRHGTLSCVQITADPKVRKKSHSQLWGDWSLYSSVTAVFMAEKKVTPYVETICVLPFVTLASEQCYIFMKSGAGVSWNAAQWQSHFTYAQTGPTTTTKQHQKYHNFLAMCADWYWPTAASGGGTYFVCYQFLS
jgi:hypothetical protein